ncbi:MAG: hypothetical protein WCG67_02620 [Ferruginibacter sp.]
MDEQRDEKLWEIAKRRADFKDSLIGFIVINTICWTVWFFTNGKWAPINTGNTPWPF